MSENQDVYSSVLLSMLAIGFLLMDVVELGLPSTILLLFISGYLFTSVLFPAKNRKYDFLGNIERLVLSMGFALSVAIVSGFILHFSVGIEKYSLLVLYSILTASLAATSVYRRRELPENQIFKIELEKWFSICREMAKPESKTEKALSLAVLLSFLLAVSSFLFWATADYSSDGFTEFYVTPSERYNGTIELEKQSQLKVNLVVENHHSRSKKYTIAASSERLVNGTRYSERHHFSVAPGSKKVKTHLFNATEMGETKLSYKLISAEQPQSNLETYLRVNVK